MSIFKRDCPECAAANPPDALLCRCGYCFDPDRLAQTDPEAYARQQERLYREYLRARLVHAQAQLQAAREAARAEPGDRARAVALRAAEAGVAALRNELRECDRRVPAVPAADAARKAVQAKQTPPPARPRPPAQGAHPRPAPPPGPRVSARPDARFRAAQAHKAEALVRAAAAASGPRRVAPGATRHAVLASRVAAKGSGTQVCPNCTATLAADAERCRCGYALGRPGEAVPALKLDAGALAIL